MKIAINPKEAQNYWIGNRINHFYLKNIKGKGLERRQLKKIKELFYSKLNTTIQRMILKEYVKNMKKLES